MIASECRNCKRYSLLVAQKHRCPFCDHKPYRLRHWVVNITIITIISAIGGAALAYIQTA